METIAITNWNDIVSPHYDASCCLLIIKPVGKRISLNIRNLSLFEKADLCAKEEVDVLICGAISQIALTLVQDRHIQVLSWICGPVDKVVVAYQKKLDLTELFAMPGCGRGGCHKKRQQRRRCVAHSV
jgi:hypothetical protein